ncbi:RNA polymerase sigma factor [Mangrovibacterium sp.]|uniref:RNA polymerase sigma factor n=1 Tax=Mangrovibacterium sp. TaxID=1961364 RepID=UPI003566B115
MEELKLWCKIKRGDNKALQELHNRYFHAMCLFASKSITDHQNVENLVSDCFIKLWENRSKIEIKTSVKSYLYRMLRNGIIDFFRRKAEIAEFREELPDLAIEEGFDEQQHYVKIHRAIAKLPAKKREVLELAVFKSLTYQEIADELNISKNTVKNQICSAYKFLKDSLQPHDSFFLVFSKKIQKITFYYSPTLILFRQLSKRLLL